MPANEPNYVAPRRLYLNAQGQVVEEGDPTRVELLVPQGGTIPANRARELGLTHEAGADAETKQLRQRVADLEAQLQKRTDSPTADASRDASRATGTTEVKSPSPATVVATSKGREPGK